MDLSIYNVIIKPKITQKAYSLNQKLKKLVLDVDPNANKPMIEEALNKLFNVEVEKIGIVVSKGKLRKVGRFFTTGKKRKKAIVTLKEGYSVDLEKLYNISGSQDASLTTPGE